MKTLSRRRSGLAPLWILATAALLLAAQCKGTTPIRELLDDPSHYDGKTVRIAGEVKSAAGVLGFGGYEVDDGSGSLPVVSQAGGAPKEGARVGVEGTFRSAFTLGTKTGAVLVEQRRYTP